MGPSLAPRPSNKDAVNFSQTQQNIRPKQRVSTYSLLQLALVTETIRVKETRSFVWKRDDSKTTHYCLLWEISKDQFLEDKLYSLGQTSLLKQQFTCFNPMPSLRLQIPKYSATHFAQSQLSARPP